MIRRWLAGALVVASVALGAVACGDDNGGVIETPTTVAPGNTGATRGYDYGG